MMVMSCEELLWKPPPRVLHLDADETHVWRASLDLPSHHTSRLRELLSEDEQTRANRFRFSMDCDRFIVARGLLRVILGRYTQQDPARLQFRYGAFGKPALVSQSEESLVRFNLSHSGNMALYAIARRRLVGIDIEYIHSNLPFIEIARRFFSADETAVIDTLPYDDACIAFYQCWTLKEAYAKARGMGLSIAFNEFTVFPTKGEPKRPTDCRGGSSAFPRWSLRMLSPAPGYVGAIAVHGQNCRLKAWEHTLETIKN